MLDIDMEGKTVYILTRYDVIRPDDLVYNRTEQSMEILQGWKPASDRLPAWVGKSLYDLHHFPENEEHDEYYPICDVIRIIDKGKK